MDGGGVTGVDGGGACCCCIVGMPDDDLILWFVLPRPGGCGRFFDIIAGGGVFIV